MSQHGAWDCRVHRPGFAGATRKESTQNCVAAELGVGAGTWSESAGQQAGGGWWTGPQVCACA